jgi:hypothetical protein
MGVSTFTQPDYTNQTATAYKTAIDGAINVLKRIAQAFAPHEQTSPNMTVRVDAGYIWSGTALTEVAAQSTGTITAPVGNPRIDRVVVDATTGAVSVVTGTPAASPTPPAIPAGKIPVAQVLLQTSSSTITNSMITDERVTAAGGSGSWKFLSKQTASASAQIDITLPAGYNAFKIVAYNIRPATDDVDLWVRFSDDDGATFEADATDYSWSSVIQSSLVLSTGSVQIVMTGLNVGVGNGLSNETTELYNFNLYIYGALSASFFTQIRHDGVYVRATDGHPVISYGTGRMTVASSDEAIRFLMSSGNIASGSFVLYGLVEA